MRIIDPDPDGDGVRDRDVLEQLGGTLPARIRMAMGYFRELGAVSAHGPQHPALQLQRLGPDGIFASFADQLEGVWGRTRAVDPAAPVP